MKKDVNILPKSVTCFDFPFIYNSGYFPKKSISFINSQKDILLLFLLLITFLLF